MLKLYKAEEAIVKVTEGLLSNGSGLAVTVKAGATKKFTVPTPSEQTAGTAFSVTLTATDEWGNTTTSYTGSKTLTWSGPGNSPSAQAPSYPATVTFTAGVSAAASITLYDAQSTTLTAKEGTTVEGTSGSFTVKAAGATSFSVPTPSEQTAGSAFSVTVTAWDTWHNTATSYTGSKTLTWSGPGNSPSAHVPSYPATVTFTAGVSAAASITLYDAQSTTLKAKEGTTIEGTSGSFTVKPGATKKFTVPTPSEQTAGTAFSVTLTATDEWGNTTTSYTGSKTLTWSGPGNSPSAQAPSYPATVTFTAGVSAAASITLYDAQSTTLKAAEGTTVEGTTGSFTVKPGATKKFTVPTPSEQTAGTAFSVTLTATDEWGNTTTSYTGSKTLTWSGPGNSPSAQAPSYPATVTFTAGVSAAASITLYDAQSTTLTAKEGTTVAGTSASFTVKAAVASRFAWSKGEVTAGAFEGTCLFTCVSSSIGASKKFKAHLSVTDAYGNIVTNLGVTEKAEVEKTSGEGTLKNATGVSIPSTGLAESTTIFEYTSPATGTSEAKLSLKRETGTTYTEATAAIKY